MIYVFDTNSLSQLFRSYYPGRFPSLWERFDRAVSVGVIVSVREVLQEVEQLDNSLTKWAKENSGLFLAPTPEELAFVARIFEVPHFQLLVRKQSVLRGTPVADPFVIAKACSLDGCVVSEEENKPNASRIPNVCEHFGVRCCDLEGFMERENWVF